MFDFLKKKQPTGEVVTFQISGMHCSSCAMNIDDALEETTGVIKSDTSYAKGKTKVEFDPKLVSKKELSKVINQLDYDAKEI